MPCPFHIGRAVLFRHGFVVGRSGGECASYRVDHHFEQMAHSGELAGVELVEQLVGVLFVHELAVGRQLSALPDGLDFGVFTSIVSVLLERVQVRE